MNREQRIQLATETLAILNAGGYDNGRDWVDLAPAMQTALASSRLIRPEEMTSIEANVDRLLAVPAPYRMTIEVVNETTLAAAARLATANPLVLNFASARNPGGGFQRGSQAQEESLARASGLYLCLQQHREMYDYNNRHRSAFYSDHMIYTPAVPVFRHDDGSLLREPFTAAILTAPAVNAGAVRANEPAQVGRIVPVMRMRVARVLSVALQMGHAQLVLGAWGCGVFQNDPGSIARLFAEQLLAGGRFNGRFHHIVFAILDRPPFATISPFQELFSA
ncbi:MAG: TIGR02452 family protein [Ardenticatenales bacterium]|nr:TIGR02452 family protein [Ardenticatenales bacterium]